LGWDGEHYRMVELGPEAIEYRISEAEAVLAFAETLTLVPAEAAVDIPDEARKLYEDLDPSYFDTILAAHGDSRVLLSDDRPFRALAAEAIGVKGVWSQSAVMAAYVSQKIASYDYCKVGVTLAEARYFYTTVNCGIFMYELQQSNWAVKPTVQALIDLLVRPQNDPFGVLSVLSELIRVGWAEKPNDHVYEEFFTAIFSGFRKAQPRIDVVGLARIALNRVEGIVYGQLFHARFVGELKNSTNLTPVATAVAEVNALRERLGTRIARILSNALRKANAQA